MPQGDLSPRLGALPPGALHPGSSTHASDVAGLAARVVGTVHALALTMRFILLCTLIAAGCTTTTPTHSEPANPGSGSSGSSGSAETPNIEDWLNQVYPALQTAGCFACHAGNESSAPAFLAGDTPLEARESLLASGLINLTDPAESLLFLKGAHEGPAFPSDTLIVLSNWIAAEAAAAHE